MDLSRLYIMLDPFDWHQLYFTRFAEYKKSV